MWGFSFDKVRYFLIFVGLAGYQFGVDFQFGYIHIFEEIIEGPLIQTG